MVNCDVSQRWPDSPLGRPAKSLASAVAQVLFGLAFMGAGAAAVAYTRSWLASPFVLFGLLIAVGPWLQRDRSPDVQHDVEAHNRLSVPARLGLAAFFAIFAAAGGGLMWMATLQPLVRAYEASRWTPARCTMTESSVTTHPSSEGGDTYGIRVRYTYEYQGTRHVGHRATLSGSMRSSMRGSKERFVEAHPAGEVVDCWVDPAAPGSSVLDRGVPGEAWITLGPALFFLIPGAGGFVWAMFFGRFDRRRDATREGAVLLASDGAATGEFIFLAVFTGLWNMMMLTFVFVLCWGWLTGDFPLCGTVVVMPFGFLGLKLLEACHDKGGVVLNPRPELRLRTEDCRVAGTVTVQCKLVAGWASHRAKKLTLTLEGQEHATSGEGTSATTFEETFHCQTLFEDTPPELGQEVALKFTIPASTMHSFSAVHNEVRWQVRAVIEMAERPDSALCFPLNVQPPRRSP